MLASVAGSMRDRPGDSPANRPAVPGTAAAASITPGARAAGGSTRRAMIRLDRIVAGPEPAPQGVRRRGARTARRRASRTRGQLQPIRVRWDDATDRYVVVVGERRWRAARLAGLETLACVVVDGAADRRGPPGGPARRERPARGPEADRAGPGLQARSWRAGACHPRSSPSGSRSARLDRPGPGPAGPPRADPGGGGRGPDRPQDRLRAVEGRRPGRAGRARQGGRQGTPQA